MVAGLAFLLSLGARYVVAGLGFLLPCRLTRLLMRLAERSGGWGIT